MSFSAEGVVHIIKWELCRGWRQHVQIWLFTKLSQMVSFQFWCCSGLLLCWPLINCSPVYTVSNWLLSHYGFSSPLRALRPPGWLPQWHCGVRVSSNKKLVGFISAIPADIRIYDTWALIITNHKYLAQSDMSHHKPLYCNAQVIVFPCAAPDWREWSKSTSCVSIRSCVQSALPQC